MENPAKRIVTPELTGRAKRAKWILTGTRVLVSSFTGIGKPTLIQIARR